MNIAVIGYGRMGRAVEAIARDRGHIIVTRIDPTPGLADAEELTATLLTGVEGVIDFSTAQAVSGNSRLYAQAGVSAVVGTTGWEHDLQEIKRIIITSGGSFLYGSNFSIGAHLMFALAARAASLIRSFTDYDIMVHEYHHKNKTDSPSGTALSIAKVILNELPRKTTIQTESLGRAIRPEELHVTSTRGGSIPGVHTVTIDSDVDSVEITHTARSRTGFALGSVLALEWLLGRKGFFRVEDFFADVFAAVAPADVKRSTQ